MVERQLRQLERRADSLARIFNDSAELTIAERRRIGETLDRTVEQIERLSMRLAGLNPDDTFDGGRLRIQVAPMTSEASRSFMRRALAATQNVAPRGWLGIVVSGTAREPRVENGELIVHYLTHPEIISVDPSSPAERAGLIPSDTLIAYDGKDVRDRDISLSKLTRPNARVLVRIRRDGRTREVPVTIADVPSRITLRRQLNAEVRTSTPLAPLPSAFAAPLGVMQLAPMTPMAPLPPMPAMPPTPPSATIVYGYGANGYGVNGVAGAQLVAVTEGLGRTLGVRQGVLVTNAPAGSPAYESGLRDGDVILRMAGETVRTVGEVRQVVGMASYNGEHSVPVELMRAKRVRKAILRW
jgi:serine protease Do